MRFRALWTRASPAVYSRMTMHMNPDERLRELESELASLRARTQVLVEGSPLGIFFDDAHDKCPDKPEDRDARTQRK